MFYVHDDKSRSQSNVQTTIFVYCKIKIFPGGSDFALFVLIALITIEDVV